MTEKFWKWVREFANEKVKQAHMNKFHHARKCPNCNTWTSEVDGCKALVDSEDNPYYELMTCNKCAYVSTWDCIGMLPTIKDKP